MIAVGFHIEHVPVQQGIKICGGVNRVKEVIALGFQIEHASVQDVKIRGATIGTSWCRWPRLPLTLRRPSRNAP